jgi:predicted Rossmann-fold nucleotide-binding protein
MKLGVIGSRGFHDYELITTTLRAFSKDTSCVLAGGAAGADALTESWCAENNVPFVLFKPYFLLDPYATYSVRHYFTRNKQIIDNADMVVAFWDGVSPGTKWGIGYAKKHNKPITVVRLPGDRPNKMAA